jgi:hypothetical protein
MPGAIKDIDNAAQLVSYAAVAQVEQVRRATGLSQEQIGNLLVKYKDPSNFSTALKNPPNGLLQNLDEVFAALHPELDRTGGLSALAVRLRRVETRDGLTARIPPMWTRELLARPSDDEFEVLTQASAVLSILLAVPGRGREVCDRYRDELEEIVDRLILIGASPPTPRNIDALILLGSIAVFAFDVVEDSLNKALRGMPLGFRVWRAVTTVVRLRLSQEGVHSNSDLQDWVRTQLDAAEDLRVASLYPARSLDLELAVAVPPEWSPPGDDWVGRVLRTRAENTKATVRERGTAALGLWERAVKHGQQDRVDVENHLRELIDCFRSEAEDVGDVAIGLRWVATTLQYVVDTGRAVCNRWPETDDPCLRVARDAAKSLDDRTADAVPERILKSTKLLVEHALLQNAGVYRRQAIDTLSAGSWTAPVSQAFDRALTHDDSEPWLRCRALFAIGFLQERQPSIERILKLACQRAKRRLDSRADDPPRGAISEMHAALFACGDCFGVPGAESQARRLRTALNGMLHELLARSRDMPALNRVAHAATYFVTVTAQTRDGTSQQILENLEDHPDLTTSSLSKWALEHRFDSKGNVRPLHAGSWLRSGAGG